MRASYVSPDRSVISSLTSAEACWYKPLPPDPSGKEPSRSVTPEDTARLAELLLGQRLIALGVLVEGAPVVGLLPYAVSEDRVALYVQASGLARHSRGLLAGAPWSGLVHEPDGPAIDPLRVPRLQLEGSVEPLAGSHPEFQAAGEAFLRRFPQAAATLQLGDFGLYRLELHGGRMILGFGRALNLSRDHFQSIARA
jgi:heme oxygenase (biliverdin-IX-beta and delta-forming)